MGLGVGSRISEPDSLFRTQVLGSTFREFRAVFHHQWAWAREEPRGCILCFCFEDHEDPARQSWRCTALDLRFFISDGVNDVLSGAWIKRTSSEFSRDGTLHSVDVDQCLSLPGLHRCYGRPRCLHPGSPEVGGALG